MYNSAELNSAIWNYQMKRYREALINISFCDIHRYIKSFIRGNEIIKPSPGVSKEVNSLDEVILLWQEQIGRKKIKKTNGIRIR